MQTITVPKMTHFQFAILTHLIDGPLYSLLLKEKLEQSGIAQTPSAFYVFLVTLKRLGYVTMEKRKGYESKYEITEKGREDWHTLLDFYKEEKFKCRSSLSV